MAEAATHLYLVRHGEAHANVHAIMGGPKGDQGLTAFGVAQVEPLRDRLAGGELGVDTLISSTLPRARESAEILAPALGLPVLLDPQVQEQNPGESDGLTIQEVRARYGPLDPRLDPYHPLAPGAETWGAFMLRVSNALHRIAREHVGQSVLVVCHGGVIDGSFIAFFQMPSMELPPVTFFTHNASITHWELRQHGPGEPRWRLERYNDVAHLSGLGTSRATPWEDLAVEPPDLGADTPARPLASERRPVGEWLAALDALDETSRLPDREQPPMQTREKELEE